MKRLQGASIGGYLRQHWRRLSIYGAVTTVGLLVVVQLLFPWNKLPLYMTIDGVDVSGWSMTDASKLLDDKYKNQPIALYFGSNTEPYREPTPAEIGLTIDVQPQVDAASYPLWLRLVPTSLWWAHAVVPSATPQYEYDKTKAGAYVKKELGKSCNIKAENASLKYEDKKLQVVPAIDGGTCELDDVQKLLTSVKPRLGHAEIRVTMDERPAKIHDDEAREFADELINRTKDVTIKANDETVDIPQDELLSWLDFKAPDSGLEATINKKRATEFLTKQVSPKVSIAAGTSHITTLDFAVVNQVFGEKGQTLDTAEMIALLNKRIEGETIDLEAPVRPVEPTKVYTRKYTKTDTGLRALLAQFAQSHGGTFGISYAELDGARRHASYQGDRAFRTASTYKLFVAYGTLKRVEQGKWHWYDHVHGGRNLSKCFDDMIVLSDNPCAETLLNKIGFKTLTDEMKSIGLTGSNFLCSCGFPVTTASDLTVFVGLLHSGQLFNKSSSTDRLISAMKRNVYRQGIPAGAKGQTADKVGFLNALLHDAAIVYGPKGTYALTILTEGSSWGTIAELTRAIEKWRA